RCAAWRETRDCLAPGTGAGLASRGIDRLYVHQAEAIEAVRAGRDVVVVTPTASGKTLCYALPALHAIPADYMGHDALLGAARRPADRGRPRRARPVPVPDEGAEPGSDSRVRRAGGG